MGLNAGELRDWITRMGDLQSNPVHVIFSEDQKREYTISRIVNTMTHSLLIIDGSPDESEILSTLLAKISTLQLQLEEAELRLSLTRMGKVLPPGL